MFTSINDPIICCPQAPSGGQIQLLPMVLLTVSRRQPKELGTPRTFLP